MKHRIGYELRYLFPQTTPVILVLNTHFTRVSDLLAPDHIAISPSVPISGYRDEFGNWCSRILDPAGQVRISADAVIKNSGLDKETAQIVGHDQVPVEHLPDETMVFLRASRFCDSDKLLDLAWELFGTATPGAGRVRAICNFVHQRIAFGYEYARVTRTASEAYQEGCGVCRDYAHLAVAFCRALNIPARYCTGYLSDVGAAAPQPSGDFAAWFEAYLTGGWEMFDPRNNVPRTGRVLIARGRDATDVAMTTTFGPNTLEGFKVWTYPVHETENAKALRNN